MLIPYLEGLLFAITRMNSDLALTVYWLPLTASWSAGSIRP